MLTDPARERDRLRKCPAPRGAEHGIGTRSFMPTAPRQGIGLPNHGLPRLSPRLIAAGSRRISPADTAPCQGSEASPKVVGTEPKPNEHAERLCAVRCSAPAIRR